MMYLQADSLPVIMPLFFSEDEAYWFEEEGLKAVWSAILELEKNQAVGSIIAISNSWKIAHYLNEKGVRVEFLSELGSVEPIEFPRGSVEALAYVVKRYGREQLCLIRDVRQLGVDPDTVRKVVALHDQSADVATATVTIPIDHPCQMAQYYRSLAVGFVLPFERERNSAEAFMSIPFAAGLPQAVSSGELLAKEAFLKGAYTGSSSIIGQSEVFLVAEEGGTARLVFPRACLGEVEGGFDIVGALGFCTDINFRALLVRRKRDGALLLQATQHAPLDGDTLLLHMEDEEAEYTVPNVFSELIGVPQELADDGFFVTLAESVQSGGYDITMPFPSQSSLWRKTARGMLDSREGCLIHGRQSFPEVYALDAGLLIGKAGGLLDSFSVNEIPRLRGHILKKDMRVSCVLDFLRCQVNNRTIQQQEPATKVGSSVF